MSEFLTGHLAKARHDLFAKEDEIRKRTEEMEIRGREASTKVYEALKNTKRATKKDYLNWLSEYSHGRENIFTHLYDSPFGAEDFFVALRGFELPTLLGASSINLIVPENITVHWEDVGHNCLYLHGNPASVIGGFVPYFNDLD